MPAKTRAENRAEIETAILRLGREHLRTAGAGGLSLRAIARDLGMVSSAIYRYVPSRDELLTLLLVQGYTDLADHVDNTADAISGPLHRERLLATAIAMRTWAVADPARWALLYGSPVPGYSAPAARTVIPGTRVIARIISELGAAAKTSALRADLPAPSAAVAADMQAVAEEFGTDLSNEIIAAATTLWATIIGGISIEVFGQYGTETIADPAALFAAQITAALSLLFAST
ncbi:MAG: WHG domain-containing protein [Gordonia sp. (in: high G+C Gram-positive bacteria)]